MILRVFQILFLVLAPFVVPAELVPPQMLASRQTVDATVVKVLPDLRSEVNYRGAIEVLAPEGELPKWELFSFDGAQVQLLEFRAWVVNKGQKTEVPSSSIQRTPVSDPGGLSKDIKVEVAFPRLKVGSRIEWTYRTLERSPPVHGFFSWLQVLDQDYHQAQGFSLDIDSATPLQHRVHDPGKALQVKKNGNRISVRLSKNLTFGVINESYGLLPRTRFPTFLASSLKSWDQVPQRFSDALESRLQEPLPPLVSGWAQEVRRNRGFNTQIEKLHQLIKNHMRYLGDWRGRMGNDLPRPLNEIIESQHGDCKDYALVMTRVLREAGYDANLASVAMDRSPVPSFYYDLPVRFFNHQLVHVRVGQTNYWLDPTAPEEIGFLSDSVTNRKALVWSRKPQLLQIPAADINQNGFRYRLSMAPGVVPGQWNSDLEVESWGLESKYAFSDQSYQSDMQKWMMLFFPDVRSVSQSLGFHPVKEKRPWSRRQRGVGMFQNVFDRTPTGDAFRLGFSNVLNALLEVDERWVSDFDFGFPSWRSYSLYLKEQNFVGVTAEQCVVESPWMTVRLSLRNEHRAAHLQFEEIFKVSEIPRSSFESKAFRKMQHELQTCLVGRVLLIEKPGSVSVPRSTASIPTGAIQLRPDRSALPSSLFRPSRKESHELPDLFGGPRRGAQPTIKLKRIASPSSKPPVAGSLNLSSTKPTSSPKPAAKALNKNSASKTNSSKTTEKKAAAKEKEKSSGPRKTASSSGKSASSKKSNKPSKGSSESSSKSKSKPKSSQ